MRKIVLAAFSLAIAFTTPAAAQETPLPSVVASTAWTAAYVKAAGVGSCHVLAPYEMQHPAEYELRPADIKALSQAKIFVYAGYESMMKSLAANVATDKIIMVKISTDYDPDSLKKSILAVAAAAGTEAAARKNIAALDKTFAACRGELSSAGLTGATVVVHAYQKRLAELFGLTVTGTFGPGPLEAKQIADLTKTKAAVVIDNWHNPVSAPLKETMPAAGFAEFINFPGKDGTRTLEDVLRRNKDRLLKARSKR